MFLWDRSNMLNRGKAMSQFFSRAGKASRCSSGTWTAGWTTFFLKSALIIFGNSRSARWYLWKTNKKSSCNTVESTKTTVRRNENLEGHIGWMREWARVSKVSYYSQKEVLHLQVGWLHGLSGCLTVFFGFLLKASLQLLLSSNSTKEGLAWYVMPTAETMKRAISLQKFENNWLYQMVFSCFLSWFAYHIPEWWCKCDNRQMTAFAWWGYWMSFTKTEAGWYGCYKPNSKTQICGLIIRW